MNYYNMFNELINILKLESEKFNQEDKEIIEFMQENADKVGQSWSGSWIGYHANVYYESLKKPPIGSNFSIQDGLYTTYSDTRGSWVEYEAESIVNCIEEMSGNPDLTILHQKSIHAQNVFDDTKSEILSIFSCLEKDMDTYLEERLAEIKKINILTQTDIIDCWRPSGQFATRDYKAVSQGMITPPHLQVKSRVLVISLSFLACEELFKIMQRVLKHMNNRKLENTLLSEKEGRIFIGHGSSFAWRDLKDFISERLNLPYDEFNRVSIAGETNISRLREMLENASFAFLVMTAEDEQADGSQYARQNVIHEVGLFQGKLGFKKAIVLLEEGCEEFSNIQGLGQIRFPKNNIKSIFEDIRAVLEREGQLS